MSETLCSTAFKEWAVICHALGTGQQTVLLRKGGIAEGPEGFRVEHDEFWLFPTYFHLDEQPPLSPPAQAALPDVLAQRPTDDSIPLRWLCRVDHFAQITDLSQIGRLAGWHWWAEETLFERFHYRRPGLWALVVRVYELPEVCLIPNSPHFAGCKSWVPLPAGIDTSPCRPVLSNEEFAQQSAALRSIWAPCV